MVGVNMAYPLLDINHQTMDFLIKICKRITCSISINQPMVNKDSSLHLDHNRSEKDLE